MMEGFKMLKCTPQFSIMKGWVGRMNFEETINKMEYHYINYYFVAL